MIFTIFTISIVFMIFTIFMIYMIFYQIGGVWGGCVQAYHTFTEKWKDVLDANVTESFILSNNKGPPWRYGYMGVRRLLVRTL